MKILVCGLGSIARRHINNLLKLGISDIILYRRKDAGENELNLPIFTNLDQALEQKPDAVLITNPTAFHIPIALKAARAGAHLFIEKPLSHNLEEVEELLKIIKEKDLVSMVAYQYRFHPALQKIKELIDSGALGKIIFGRVEVGQYLPDWHPDEDYRNSYSARKDLGGGVILTLIHEIDYLTWFLGKPKSISCTAGHFSNLEIDVEDLAEIFVKYENGALGQIHLDYIQKAPSRWLKIVGERAEVYWDYFKNEVKLFDGQWQTIYKDENFDKNAMFLNEMKHFLNCIKGEEKPMVDIESDLPTFKLALSAKQSAQEERPACEDDFLKNTYNLDGKVAVITGGTGLLGREYAKALLSCGASVVLADIDKEETEKLTRELSGEFGGRVLGLAVDISKKEEVLKMVQETINVFRKIDILINNAGISGKFESGNAAPLFEDYPKEEWDKAWDVNMSGMFLCAQAVGKEMVKSGKGVMVNVSSIYGVTAPDQRLYNKEGELTFVKPVSYSATKSAVLNFTRYLAAYWGDKNIRVNTLTPGGVFDNQDSEFVRKYNHKTPLGRMANPDDVVGPMLFLVSDASKYMTGANLVVDGGWTAW